MNEQDLQLFSGPAYLFLCALVFGFGYTLNLLYVTVFYHRAFAHRSIQLRPWLERFVVHTGSWVTGLDPKGWVCMHRLHHEFSDTALDPHSPVIHGIWKVLPLQLYSYNKTLSGLIFGKRKYTSVVKDLGFSVNWLNRKQLWYLPYLSHAAIAILIGVFFQTWLLAGAYWIGIMSHPIQGWMVNALAHRFGYRNFDTSDNSKNNSVVAWLVCGEGYQNNHHFNPSSPKFSWRPGEVDLGFVLCRFLSAIGVLKLSSPTHQLP